MKNLFFAVLFFGSILSANAQFLNWGVKGGVNYNVNGDLYVESVVNGESISLDSNDELGYHFGLLAEIKLPLFLYIRPELLYTHTESSYSYESNEARLKMDRIDIPVLVGFRVFGIGRFFFGPSFQYVVNTDLSGSDLISDIQTVSYDDFNIAGQIGLGLNFGRFGADIRWEAGLTDSQAIFAGIEDGDLEPEDVKIDVDTQNMQFLLSVYWKFGKGK